MLPDQLLRQASNEVALSVGFFSPQDSVFVAIANLVMILAITSASKCKNIVAPLNQILT
jgi:hypothetical protein